MFLRGERELCDSVAGENSWREVYWLAFVVVDEDSATMNGN